LQFQLFVLRIGSVAGSAEPTCLWQLAAAVIWSVTCVFYLLTLCSHEEEAGESLPPEASCTWHLHLWECLRRPLSGYVKQDPVATRTRCVETL